MEDNDKLNENIQHDLTVSEKESLNEENSENAVESKVEESEKIDEEDDDSKANNSCCDNEETVVNDLNKVHCWYCGNLIDENAKYCTYCGKKSPKPLKKEDLNLFYLISIVVVLISCLVAVILQAVCNYYEFSYNYKNIKIACVITLFVISIIQLISFNIFGAIDLKKSNQKYKVRYRLYFWTIDLLVLIYFIRMSIVFAKTISY